MKPALFAVILVSLMLLGCTGPAPEQNVTNETVQPPAKVPTFSISSPLNQQVLTVPGDSADVTLSLSTQNLVVKRPGGAAAAGEGYFKVSVDGGSATTVSTKSHVVTGLSLGQHKITVELVNNDGSAYSPRIMKEVTFTLEKQKPTEYVPQDYTVKINERVFEPASLTVKVGDRVTWVNIGKMPQTATCFIGGKEIFDTDTIGPNKSATITMNMIMECDYYSQMFRAMTGKIKVESNDS